MRVYKVFGCEWFGRVVVDCMFIVIIIKLSVSLLYFGVVIKFIVMKINIVESCIFEVFKGEFWC